MRPLMLLAVGLFLAFGPLAACGGDGKGELDVYIWSEYIDPDLVDEFTKETGVAVRLSFYESSEAMVAKMQHASGASQYDLVIAPSQTVPMLARLGLVQPIDHARIPNLGNLDPAFRDPSYDRGGRYSVAYQWASVGILYDSSRVAPRTAWADIFVAERRAGTYLLLDEMRDMLAVALLFQGRSANSTVPEEVRAAGELLLDAKRGRGCQGFEGGVGGKNKVATGIVDAAVVWNGDALRAVEEDESGHLVFVIPEEGSLLLADTMALPAQAVDVDAAYRFIDYILRADVGARLSAFTKFATPNRASLPLLPEKDRLNPALYPPPEMMGRLTYQEDIGEANGIYDEVWTSVKTR